MPSHPCSATAQPCVLRRVSGPLRVSASPFLKLSGGLGHEAWNRLLRVLSVHGLKGGVHCRPWVMQRQPGEPQVCNSHTPEGGQVDSRGPGRRLSAGWEVGNEERGLGEARWGGASLPPARPPLSRVWERAGQGVQQCSQAPRPLTGGRSGGASKSSWRDVSPWDGGGRGAGGVSPGGGADSAHAEHLGTGLLYSVGKKIN